MKGEFMSFSISGFPTPQDNNTTRRQSRQQKLQGFFTGGKPIKPNNNVQIVNNNNNGLTRIDGGVTKFNNEFGIFKDAQGNSIARIDYHNNDAPNIFDEEEVRSKDGKLKSRTSRAHTFEGDLSYYKKYEYNENEELTRISVTKCDASGKVLDKYDISPDEEPSIVGHVGLGVSEEDGDKELKAKMDEYGFKTAGRD